MSFAPRARLSAAPEDLQTTATRGDTMAASNPLEQVSLIMFLFIRPL